MCASVNEPRKGEPRCPLVPKITSCSGSSRSGRRSKYSRSSRAASISISLGAGLPARGEIVMDCSLLRHRAGLGVPDFGSILGDRTIARELPGTGNIEDGLARPCVAVAVQFGQPLVCLKIGFEVRQMHVVISIRQKRTEQRAKDPRFVAAEVLGGDHVQRGAGFGLVVVMPVRIVPTAAALHLI